MRKTTAQETESGNGCLVAGLGVAWCIGTLTGSELLALLFLALSVALYGVARLLMGPRS